MQEVRHIHEPRTYRDGKLNLRHRLFVNELLSDPNRNATSAYLKVYPNCSYDSARELASSLLTKTNIKSEIQAKTNELLAKSDIRSILNKEKIITDIERITVKAEEKEQFSPALKGKELLGKELGMFIDKQVNVNVSLEDFIRAMNNREQPEAIDTEAITDKPNE